MEEIIKQIDLHKDNPNMLSELGLKLSGQLFYHNTKMAQAELNEKESMKDYMDEVKGKGEKPTISQAEIEGVIRTSNYYGTLKSQWEWAQEYLNMIKTRIKVLTGEKEMSR